MKFNTLIIYLYLYKEINFGYGTNRILQDFEEETVRRKQLTIVNMIDL